MKKTFLTIIIVAILSLSVLSLVSCNGKEKDFGYKQYSFSFDVLEDEKAILISDEATLRFRFSNKNSLYKKASIVIDAEESCFSYEGFEDMDEVRIELGDLSRAKYPREITKDLKIKYTGPSVTDGCVLGAVTVQLELELDNGEKETFYHYGAAFASKGQYIAFTTEDGDRETYLDICKKMPDWEILNNYSDNPLFDWPLMGSYFSESEITLNVAIPTTKPLPLSDSTSISINVSYGNFVLTSGILKIEADGFSISGNDGVSHPNEYSFSYDDVNFSNYSLKRKDDYSPQGCGIYRCPEFAHSEVVVLTCNDISEHSGTILIGASSKGVGGDKGAYVDIYGDSNDINLYYATDGKYIAYSVESEDAAKRALYGDFGYFWKVTVPEYFDDLFDGCD